MKTIKKAKIESLFFAKKYIPDIITQDFENLSENAKNEGKKI